MTQSSEESEKYFHVESSLCICSFIFTCFGFFIIYRKTRNTMIEYLIMVMCLSESILFYCIFVAFINVVSVVNFFKARKIFDFFTMYVFGNGEENSFPTNMLFLRINNCIYSSFLALSLISNIFYNFEVISLIRNPLGEGPGRKTLYDIILLICFLGAFIFNYFKGEMVEIDENDSTTMIDDLWRSQIFNFVIVSLLILIAFISIIFAFGNLCAKSSFASKGRWVFFIKHTSYIVSYILFVFFPIFGSLMHKMDFATPAIMISLSGIVLTSIRLFEIGFCNTCCFMTKESSSERLLEDDTESVYSAESKPDSFSGIGELVRSNTKADNSIKDSRALEDIENQSDIGTEKFKTEAAHVMSNLSFSAMLIKSFLFENMFYIIQGINEIAKSMTDKIEPISEESYKEYLKYKFDNYTINSQDDLLKLTKHKGQTSTSKKLMSILTFQYCCKSVGFIEYCPKIFRNIFWKDGVTQEHLVDSFNLTKNLGNILNLMPSEGKSGSFFFFTHDNKFIIKTISESEKTTFIDEFSKSYYEHVMNNVTLICRIYGIYTLKIGFTASLNLILMENILAIDSSIKTKYKFDLKGSEFSRETKDLKNEYQKKTLKDKDFKDLKTIDKKLIDLAEDEADEIINSMKEDLTFLRDNNLMDYSFFIVVLDYTKDVVNKGLQNNRMYISKNKKYVYFLGIIDYLTKYGSIKKMETNFRTFLHYSERNFISAVNPVFYADRFNKFMLKYVFNYDS